MFRTSRLIFVLACMLFVFSEAQTTCQYNSGSNRFDFSPEQALYGSNWCIPVFPSCLARRGGQMFFQVDTYWYSGVCPLADVGGPCLSTDNPPVAGHSAGCQWDGGGMGYRLGATPGTFSTMDGNPTITYVDGADWSCGYSRTLYVELQCNHNSIGPYLAEERVTCHYWIVCDFCLLCSSAL